MLVFTLISASFAENVHGDESTTATTSPDLTTIPVLDTSNTALAAQLAASSTLTSAVVDTTPAPTAAALASSTENTAAVATSSTQDTSSSASTTPVADTSSDTPDADAGSDAIQTYTVQSGDTLSAIAKKFNISVNTIVWANNITAKTPIKNGETLVILPIDGIQYTVKSGDNLQSIANKFKGDVSEIAQFNNLKDTDTVKAGDTIIIPHGESSGNTSTNNSPSKPPKQSVVAVNNSSAVSTPPASGNGNIDAATGLMRPIVGGIKTQGIHGHNAVDLADSLNTPIMAAMQGTVIVAKTGGWNGGYGNYVVVSHPNGEQTLYAHMNSVAASVGEQVSQGEVIGYMGETGDATGVHVHFEVRGGVNPF